MQTLSANEAKIRFGRLLDLAQHEPVRIRRRNHVVGVIVSAQDFEAMREFYAHRLQASMAAAAAEAAAAGLSDEGLEALLADES